MYRQLYTLYTPNYVQTNLVYLFIWLVVLACRGRFSRNILLIAQTFPRTPGGKASISWIWTHGDRIGYDSNTSTSHNSENLMCFVWHYFAQIDLKIQVRVEWRDVAKFPNGGDESSHKLTRWTGFVCPSYEPFVGWHYSLICVKYEHVFQLQRWVLQCPLLEWKILSMDVLQTLNYVCWYNSM